MGDNIYSYLVTTALYALKSKSLPLVYDAYGQAKMAFQLNAITAKEFVELSRMLLWEVINNPQAERSTVSTITRGERVCVR